MYFFDFHHHTPSKKGIFNQDFMSMIDSSCYSIGIHPMDINQNWEENFEHVKKQAAHQHCVAIGECGLDRLANTNLPLQKEVFKAHITLANTLKKPVIIHCVKMFHELHAFKKIAETPLIIHGFNKKETLAFSLLKQGFYLSFGNAILHRVYLQNIIKEAPLEKLFLETDAKDINIETIYLKVAELKGIPIEDLVQQIEQNKKKVLYG